MIEVRGLAKAFGPVRALRGVELGVKDGEAVAVVGPNAAGKTTLIRCVLGLVRPDAGEILFRGLPVQGQWRYRARIGYMPQVARFADHLTLRELLTLVADVRGGQAPGRDALLELFGLGPLLDRPLRGLSGGTRQKISAVLALMFDPELLILDEPTAGLDPLASTRLKDRLRAERALGKAVILTSHVMADVEELADRVLFLVEGRAYFDGTLAEIRTATGEERLERAIARLMARNGP